MGYFCLVPEDAYQDEHLTLVWCGDAAADADDDEEMEYEATLASLSCPVDGWVFKESFFGAACDIVVAEVALPHSVHLMRHRLAVYDQSDYGWQPHVTVVGDRDFSVGEHIKFVRVEWRP